MNEKIVVCLACCRPESFKLWMSKWSKLFKKHNVDVIVSWDTDDKAPKEKGVTFIKRKDFPSFIPKGSSACRSAAVGLAYQIEYDIYIFLDDDVLPPEEGDPIQEYINGFQFTPHNAGYYDVGKHITNTNEIWMKSYTRGFPYKERHITPVVAQYGGWDNVPDLDARDSKSRDCKDHKFERGKWVVPKYMGFTGCFMNCAFKHEVVPCLYHMYMGTKTVGYDRFDDIWGSLMLKRICDHVGWTIMINGDATCWHDRASDNTKSVFQEQVGHKFNEDMWDKMLMTPLSKERTVKGNYYTLTKNLPDTQCVCAREWIDNLK